MVFTCFFLCVNDSGVLLRLLIKCEISFFDFDGVVESDAGGVVAVLFVLAGRMAMAAVR